MSREIWRSFAPRERINHLERESLGAKEHHDSYVCVRVCVCVDRKSIIEREI